MKRPKAKDVDAYIADSDRDARPKLEELRTLIKSTIPKVEEGISWGVPFYKYHGQIGGFAAYKKHVSFGPWLDVLRSEDRKLLEKKGYVTGKRTIQIRYDQRVPAAVVKRILRTIARMNEAKRAAE